MSRRVNGCVLGMFNHLKRDCCFPSITQLCFCPLRKAKCGLRNQSVDVALVDAKGISKAFASLMSEWKLLMSDGQTQTQRIVFYNHCCIFLLNLFQSFWKG